jgi:hypothetical protein
MWDRKKEPFLLNSSYEVVVGFAWPCFAMFFCERFSACTRTLERLAPLF